MRVLREAFPMLVYGMSVTVQVSIISLFIAVFLGLFTCLMGMSRNPVLSFISKFYIWLIRGTPLLVQVYFIYFGFPQMLQSFGIAFRFSTPFSAGIVALSLNAGAYIAELFRGGIQAVDPGQMEAARSLGLTSNMAMFKVILPQAVRIAIPSLVNQFIITLKDTSIISVIGLAEIAYRAKIYIGRTMESFATWSVVAIMYLVVISVLSWLSRYVEGRLTYGDKSQGK